MNKDAISLLVISRGSQSSRYIHINLKLVKSILFFIIAIFTFFVTSFFYESGTYSQTLPAFVVNSPGTNNGETVNNKDKVDDDSPEVVEDYLERPSGDDGLEKTVPIEYRLSERMLEVEEKLKNIQNVLKKKGLGRGLSVGGEFVGADKLKDDNFTKLENDIDKITRTIREYPIGRPSRGPISSYFGYRKDPFNHKKAFHPGLDLNANYGDRVISTASGKVVRAGWCHGYGKCIVIRHHHGYKTLYGHLSKIMVRKGESIDSGQEIGLVGSTGRSTGPHLHYEILKNGKKINPYKYLTLG